MDIVPLAPSIPANGPPPTIKITEGQQSVGAEQNVQNASLRGHRLNPIELIFRLFVIAGLNEVLSFVQDQRAQVQPLEGEIFGQGNGSISNSGEDMVSEKEGTNFLIKLKELRLLPTVR